MRTLIEHATLLTLDDDNHVLHDASLALDGRKIVGVGEIPEHFVPDDVLDAREMLALPAFFNAHSHAAMTLERGWAEDLTFDRWLNEKIWVAESALEAEDVYWGTALAAAEMIRSGTVGFADHYFWMDEVGRAVEESGMKALLAWCHFGNEQAAELGNTSFEDTIAFVENWQDAGSGRIHTILGPHSPYMDPPATLERFVEEAHRLGLGAHFHLSESEAQVQNSLKQYGKTPVQHVADLGLLDLPKPSLVAHCNAATEEDMVLLAEKGTYVAHAPKTYQKLAMKMPPLTAMLEHGVNVALGSDGPASNSDFNMLEIMRIAGLYQKISQGDPTTLPRTQLLQLATSAPAAALGFPESGVLAPGHPADLLLVDTRAPHWIPRHDLLAGVVYTAHPGDVTHVWCDGQLLYRKGEFLTLDIDRIRWEAEKRAFRMVGRPMQAMRAYRA